MGEGQGRVVDTRKKELNYWVRTGNKSALKKISQLMAAILLNPYQGIGKPEPLKHDLTGTCSRRINKEHRLVYEVLGDKILIHSAKGHY